MKNLVIIAIILILGLGIITLLKNNDVSLGSSYSSNISYENCTSSVVEISSTAATTTERIDTLDYIEYCNPSWGLEAWLDFVATDTSVTTGEGIYLDVDSCRAFDPSTFIYRGRTWIIASSSATSTIGVMKCY